LLQRVVAEHAPTFQHLVDGTLDRDLTRAEAEELCGVVSEAFPADETWEAGSIGWQLEDLIDRLNWRLFSQ
jgi:hypothetical protein